MSDDLPYEETTPEDVKKSSVSSTPEQAIATRAIRAQPRQISSTPGSPSPTPDTSARRRYQGRWLDASPLSVALRRKRLLRPGLGRNITDNRILNLGRNLTDDSLHTGGAPQEPQSQSSAASLHTIESLEIIAGPHADLVSNERLATTSSPKDCDKARPLPPISKSPRVEKRRRPAKQSNRAHSITPERPSTPERSKARIGSAAFIFPRVGGEDPRRQLNNKILFFQRVIIGGFILAVNIGCLVAALESERHLWVLIVILFVKAKDILSTLIQIGWLLFRAIWRRPQSVPDMSRKWIIACITAYAETEEQIMRTIDSVIDFAPAQHRLAITIIFDGKPQDILCRFDSVQVQARRPYQTWRFAHNEVNIYAGHLRSIPVIIFEKIGNAGKKDSLILCHDLFNHMRKNAPEPTKKLRLEVWNWLLPEIIKEDLPTKFDYLFFTDADSLIHEGAISRLAAALTEDPDSIGACGLVLAEMTKDNAWSIWYLWQQFQYTFGQFVRRRAEGIWGRVTCLPGCVTMIKNRPEMAGAVELYAKPITDRMVFQHQIQYLGTDRRITWAMLEQGKYLRTLFVPEATSQTVAPQNWLHYLSQRRRWGSNAFFNDFYYAVGENSWAITRLWAIIDILRQAIVYYRLANTCLFIYGLSRHFLIIKLVPYLVVTQTPSIWFLYLTVFYEPILRKQTHKLVLGWLLNKLVSPFFSIIVFTRILWNLGSAVWGRTGASTHAANVIDILHHITPKRTWTPQQISTLVRETIRGRSEKKIQEPAVVMPENAAGEPVPAPITKIISGNHTMSSSFNSPATPRSVYLPADDVGSPGTVRRFKRVRISDM